MASTDTSKSSTKLNSFFGVFKAILSKPEKKTDSPKKPYDFVVESPLKSYSFERKIVVKGWIVPFDETSIVDIRINNNGKIHKLKHGIKRQDVIDKYTQTKGKDVKANGFLGEIDFEDGSFAIELDTGEGYKTLYSIKIKYTAEKTFESYFNPQLATLAADNSNLLDNKKRYYHEESISGSYERADDDPKLIALYLPQFHPIKENDAVWGKGFTEWTNVVSGQSRFVGHQQPLLPADLGFYDLRIKENIKNQIDLAKQSGIYGFCFYYYWFSGERLLEKPLDIFVENKEWDFNFMICWANENWTKRWDGRENEVIVSQKYLEDDPLAFIKDIEHILLDERYIRSDGKPRLGIYRGSELEDPARYIKTWRKYMKKQHNLEIEVVTMMNFDTSDPRPLGFDGAIEFEPMTTYKRKHFTGASSKKYRIKDTLLDKNFEGRAVDYRDLMPRNDDSAHYDFPTYRSLAPSWDNDARRKGNGSLILRASNPDLYGEWLDMTLKQETSRQKAPTIFINAWNEWAEGAMMEPTQHNGHATLNRTKQVLSKYSQNATNRDKFPLYGIKRTEDAKIAVIVHVFYEDEWLYISKKIKKMGGLKYDLFVTLSTNMARLAETMRQSHPGIHITTVPNRGRDVLPFLFMANRIHALGYEYILKLHTKRSLHREDGKAWFSSVIDNLVKDAKSVDDIITTLEKGASIVGPAGHYVSLDRYAGSNMKAAQALVRKIYKDKDIILPIESQGFFAGTMFWCRSDALEHILDLRLVPEDFEPERGQIDGTLAHAIERLLTVLPSVKAGDSIYQTSDSVPVPVGKSDIITDYIYASSKETHL